MSRYDWNAAVDYHPSGDVITGSGTVEADTPSDAEVAARERVERSYTTVRTLTVSPADPNA